MNNSVSHVTKDNPFCLGSRAKLLESENVISAKTIIDSQNVFLLLSPFLS
jgi:hypothetical protein